jgi:hypothetical protein
MSKKVEPPKTLVNELESSAFFHKRKVLIEDESMKTDDALKDDSKVDEIDKDKPKKEKPNYYLQRKLKDKNKKFVAPKQIDFDQSEESFSDEKLISIIKSLKDKRVGRRNTPVRMTDHEKNAYEEYVNAIIQEGIDRHKFSISKLLRICTRYMILTHPSKLKELIKQVYKDDEELY